MPSYGLPSTQFQYLSQHGTWYAATAILSAIGITQKDIHDCKIIDSGTISHYLLTKAPKINKHIALFPLSDTMLMATKYT